MAYAINEKGTRTCHAKRWPSLPSGSVSLRNQNLMIVGKEYNSLHRQASLSTFQSTGCQCGICGQLWSGRVAQSLRLARQTCLSKCMYFRVFQ